MGDWRDPLDPYLDAQVIYSQYSQGRSTIVKKHLPGGVEEREESPGVTATPADGGASEESEKTQCCRNLLEVLDELAYHHSLS